MRIRHGSREARIDLSATDCSELGFAAFYADCVHEVRPVQSGHRVCLVFKLLRAASSDTPAASAPSYDAEVEQAARLISAAFTAEGTAHKLVRLLEHQYSQDELGFAALKGVDAAGVAVLRRAADAAGCRCCPSRSRSRPAPRLPRSSVRTAALRGGRRWQPHMLDLGLAGRPA